MPELGDDRAAVLEEVSNLLRDFNQSIQEEAKDRMYRFHVKRLIKGHSRGLDSVDEDLDFITDDDDIAVLSLSRVDQRCGHLATWRLLQLPGAM